MSGRYEPGSRVRVLPDRTGTVHWHTRLWSWDEGRSEPRMDFEKVAVDLDDGSQVSVEPKDLMPL